MLDMNSNEWQEKLTRVEAEGLERNAVYLFDPWDIYRDSEERDELKYILFSLADSYWPNYYIIPYEPLDAGGGQNAYEDFLLVPEVQFYSIEEIGDPEISEDQCHYNPHNGKFYFIEGAYARDIKYSEWSIKEG